MRDVSPTPPNLSSEFLKSSVVAKKKSLVFLTPLPEHQKTEIDLRFCQSWNFYFPSTIPSYQYPWFFFPSFEKKAAKLLFLDFSNDICGGTLSLRLRLDSFYQRLGSHEGPAFRPTTTYFWHTILRDHRHPKKWWERNTLKFIRRIHFRNERCIDGVFEFGGSNCEPECVVVELVRNLAVSRVSPFF